MELLAEIMQDTSCIICCRGWVICCNCWLLLWTAHLCFCRTSVSWEICAPFHSLCKTSCGGLMIVSRFFWCSLMKFTECVWSLSVLTVFTVNAHSFVQVHAYIKIAILAFPNLHLNTLMMLSCLQNLQGKGKETSHSTSAVKFFCSGHLCVQ